MKSEIFPQINVRKQATALERSENNNQDKCKKKKFSITDTILKHIISNHRKLKNKKNS